MEKFTATLEGLENTAERIGLTAEEREQIAKEYNSLKRRERYRNNPEREKNNRTRQYIKYLTKEGFIVEETHNGETVLVLRVPEEIMKGGR